MRLLQKRRASSVQKVQSGIHCECIYMNKPCFLIIFRFRFKMKCIFFLCVLLPFVFGTPEERFLRKYIVYDATVTSDKRNLRAMGNNLKTDTCVFNLCTSRNHIIRFSYIMIQIKLNNQIHVNRTHIKHQLKVNTLIVIFDNRTFSQ